MNNFGDLVRQARKERGMTQETLARKVKTSVINLRNIEHNKSVPGWVLWLKLCTVLNIDIAAIQDKYIRPQL